MDSSFFKFESLLIRDEFFKHKYQKELSLIIFKAFAKWIHKHTFIISYN